MNKEELMNKLKEHNFNSLGEYLDFRDEMFNLAYENSDIFYAITLEEYVKEKNNIE